MNKPASHLDLKDFFSASEARIDRWRSLHRVAQALGARPSDKLRAEAVALLGELGPLEDYQAYPGPHQMAQLQQRLSTGNWAVFARLVQRISAALLADSYQEDPKAWHDEENDEPYLPDALPPALARVAKRRPYFEVLLVSPAERSAWPELRNQLRRLRRDPDEFIYEPVVVGSFEDALLATILNCSVQAVVISEGYPFASQHSLPALRDFLARHAKLDPAEFAGRDSGLQLARAIHRIRPELDVYLVTDREPEEVAGLEAARTIRRIFYAVEEILEIHLSLLDGVAARYRTPYFDNLKHYAQRPVGTFHALPVARGKSIFKSNWIRDVGEFYGETLFLAESSATTGGLDSLLEPTGNLKVAQEAAARAFGGDHCYFVTNGTSTSNKIIHQAVVQPGDIVLIDRDCHKSHHYGLVLAGGQPYYIDAFPLTQYSMYGSLAIRPIKEALLRLKAEGKLDRVRMLVLTNCTFDGHVANVKRTMEECLAIKPDLIFLWDEAWFGYARFTPYLRRRTAMGAAAALREQFADPAYRERYKQFKATVGSINPKNAKLLDTHLLPDPDVARIRVYESNSVHKSMSSLRQGSVIVVSDQDFPTLEEAFHEAFFTHTSTSPNLQILATLDTARRQMELEGYLLVGRAISLALELRREINTHPLISKYFKALTPAEMIPAKYRQSGYADYEPGTWVKAVEALDNDEFFLDPTRVTLLCGRAGVDGTQFKGILASEYDIQINKTSRNS
ncbi:MAG TPA: hypothetical protein VFJ90_11535, partial [Candidatus Didemnitutus sp.]|nr:hypothetical protein [Candidatus Didemnitutus sp.]